MRRVLQEGKANARLNAFTNIKVIQMIGKAARPTFTTKSCGVGKSPITVELQLSKCVCVCVCVSTVISTLTHSSVGGSLQYNLCYLSTVNRNHTFGRLHKHFKVSE